MLPFPPLPNVSIKTGAGEAADVIFAGENGKANVAALSFGNSDNTEAADSNPGCFMVYKPYSS